MKRRAKKIAEPEKHPWPFNPEDSAISVAMARVDSLLEKIHQKKWSFDESSLQELRKLSAPQIKTLNLHYTRTFEDLKLALSGDAFCLEAYSNYTKPQMKLVLELLKHIRALKPDAKMVGKKLRVAKRTLSKKKTPEELTAKVLYLEKDKETGIASCKPTEAVGAAEMWVYNTKTHKVGCYISKSDEGLSIKGTTILNYDETLSLIKILRKPKLQLRDLMRVQLCFGSEDRWIRECWDRIKAVRQVISPRLNRETLILKVIRPASQGN